MTEEIKCSHQNCNCTIAERIDTPTETTIVIKSKHHGKWHEQRIVIERSHESIRKDKLALK